MLEAGPTQKLQRAGFFPTFKTPITDVQKRKVKIGEPQYAPNSW